MNPKKKNMKMHRLVCICQLLIEDLDELKVSTPRTVKFKSDLIGFVESLSDELKDTTLILKSTYFSDITKKIDTIMRANFIEG